jgi:hypothetical protein
MIVVPALLLPVVAACALQKVKRPPLRLLAIGLFFLFQLPYFYFGIHDYQCPWYNPPARNRELAEVVRWIEEHIPSNEAIATDFETGTAVLAHGRHPILVQPKYETARSRRRIEASFEAFAHGDLAGYRAFLIDNDCRYVLVNREFWNRNLYIAGFQADAHWRPDPRTPLANFNHPEARVYENLPGFRLVFRSGGAQGPGYMRVFELVDE